MKQERVDNENACRYAETQHLPTDLCKIVIPEATLFHSFRASKSAHRPFSVTISRLVSIIWDPEFVKGSERFLKFESIHAGPGKTKTEF